MRKLLVSAHTSVGMNRRVNEDRIVLSGVQRLYAVIDGMGGSDDGEYAAQLLADELRSLEDPNPQKVQKAFYRVHTRLKKEEDAGGGTAACVASVALFQPVDDVMLMAIVHVGDTRVYHCKSEKPSFIQLTTDHRGPGRNTVTRSIGTRLALRESEIGGYYETTRAVLREGDRVLLATDGLTNFVARATLYSTMARLPIETVVPQLEDEAMEGQFRLKRGDNVSFIVLHVL